MKNPFLKRLDSNPECVFIDSDCSVNKVIIAELPIKGIDDEIQGKSADSFFSTKIINEYINSNADKLGLKIDSVNSKQLSKYVSVCLDSDDVVLRNSANQIVKKFGYRLGMILLTLKTGLEKNKKARPEWTDEHWRYWAQLDTVILVGGLSNDKFGEGLRRYAIDLFEIAGVKPYDIKLFNNASHLGIMGCASQIKAENSVNIVFDFGQTNIKRSVIEKKDGSIIHERAMPSISSKYMTTGIKDEKVAKEQGILLNEYIVNIIKDTYEEVSKEYNLGDEIIIGIANYTVNGALNSVRGGYAKMALLADNYSDYLGKELSTILHKNIETKLIHDGTAIALHFCEYKNSVCLSLGTAFGVGFPLE